MKIVLYNAISLDGFIATPEGDSEWVSECDAEIFGMKCRKAGCVILGRKTFEQYPELYPMQNVTTIILTRDRNRSSHDQQVTYVHSIDEAIKAAKSFDQAILAGGSQTNSAFFEASRVDEVFLSVHPLTLGSGLPCFGTHKKHLAFTLLDVNQLGDGLVQTHYSVTKRT